VIFRTLPAALLLGALVAVASAMPDSGTIRVAIVENARTVELRGADIAVTETGGCESCSPRSWRTDAVRAAVTGGARQTPLNDGVACRP